MTQNLQKSIVDTPHERTIEQIGKSLNECGKFAADCKQEIRVEVYGNATKDPSVIKQIMNVADHPRVTVCWNCNQGETINGSIKQNFDLLKKRIGHVVHIHDLFDSRDPYRELFSLLRGMGFQGYCLSESPATSGLLRVMRYDKAMWEELIHY